MGSELQCLLLGIVNIEHRKQAGDFERVIRQVPGEERGRGHRLIDTGVGLNRVLDLADTFQFRNERRIVITEVPYQILRSTITEKTAAGVKSGVIKDVSAVNDASDRKHPVRIEVDLKSGANEDVTINQIYQYTPFQSNYHIMNIALVGGRPETLTLKRMIALYVDHRKDVIR
ncbi:MAG: hypothetical protein IID18_10170, partial [Nitrospinae bacterium]|nr:hypothetical protein [Nitrospinota bacterium]